LLVFDFESRVVVKTSADPSGTAARPPSALSGFNRIDLMKTFLPIVAAVVALPVIGVPAVTIIQYDQHDRRRS